MLTIAIDTETDLIGPGNVVPRMVCTSAAYRDETNELQSVLLASSERDDLLVFWQSLLEDDEIQLVFHNAGFDLAVAARELPELLPLIWRKLASGELVTDTAVRERILRITTTGDVSYEELPDGSKLKLKYSLADLAERHLGVDMREEKDDPEGWRLNFAALMGLPADEYPEAAAGYARNDAVRTLEIYERQEEISRGNIHGPHSTRGEYEKTALSFALYLVTARGWHVDPVERDRLRAWVAEELRDDKLELLVEAKILRPERPPAPYANQKKRVAELFEMSAEDVESRRSWTDEELQRCRDAGIRTRAGQKGSIDTKKLHQHVRAVCERLGVEVLLTEPSERYPEGQVSTKESFVAELAPHDEVLSQFHHRQGLQQIVNKELPPLESPIVHFNYTPVVSSYRTSSHGAQKGRELYPATQGHNVNPKVRRAYVARPGMVLCSADYDRLELCTLAQKCYELFGQSRMRDLINEGVDLHAYLGAQIALEMQPDFAGAVYKFREDPMAVYRAFTELKGSADEEVAAIYAKFRKLAKPTGLGYPGGLGPAKFVNFAASKAYKVHVDEETASKLREIWFGTFPEMRSYFDWVNSNCVDPINPGDVDEETGRRRERYCYYTPLGLYRAGCAFTECANGAGLQSFAADGFTLATFNAVRACSDPEFGSVLYGAHVLNQVHDEIICEWEDDERSSERAEELARVMRLCMEVVVPDVKITVEPALMRRWDKDAKSVRDEQGRLVVWEDEER